MIIVIKHARSNIGVGDEETHRARGEAAFNISQTLPTTNSLSTKIITDGSYSKPSVIVIISQTVCIKSCL